MKTVDIRDAKTGLSGLLAETEKSGKRIVICRDGKPVADLVPHHLHSFSLRTTIDGFPVPPASDWAESSSCPWRRSDGSASWKTATD